MELTGIDHFVLTVEDVAASCAFYDRLGGDVVTFGGGRKAVQFGDQKINLHPVDNDVDVVAASPTSGGGDFCLVTETPVGDVERRLRELDVEIVRGPVERSGPRARLRRCTSETPTATSLRSAPTPTPDRSAIGRRYRPSYSLRPIRSGRPASFTASTTASTS